MKVRILSILLFAVQIGFGQIYIDSYRFASAAPTNLLLDDYPGATAAYSLRKLDKDYAGAAIEIQRVSPAGTTDIGFDSNGDLDVATINTYCSGTTCYVSKWYDQSGNGYNATATVGNQPVIYAAGAVITEGGKPAMDFDGTNDFLNNSMPQFTTHTIISVSLTDTESLSVIAGTDQNVSFGTTFGYISSTDFRIQSETPVILNTTNINFERLFYVYATGSSGAIYANQILKSSGSISGNFDYNIIGARRSQNPLYYNGTQQELIVYPSAKNLSAEITGINSAINSYYSIY